MATTQKTSKELIKELTPGTIFTAGGDTYLRGSDLFTDVVSILQPWGVAGDPIPVDSIADNLDVEIHIIHTIPSKR